MTKPFWANSTLEPLRKFRFTIQNGDKSTVWWAKSVSKPSFEISSNEYQLINHKFKYPGIVTWNDVDVTIIDSTSLKNGKKLYDKLKKIGYNPDGELDGIDKTKAIKEAGSWLIQQIDANGEPIETWKLINPWIKSVKFGDLDYGSDDLVEITLTISIDRAELS